jgi:hypothetical protein
MSQKLQKCEGNMRDYLNATEKNQLMLLMSIVQTLDGDRRNVGIDGPKIGTLVEEWDRRGNLTKEERKNLKTSETFLKKFVTSVYDRLSQKEQSVIDKKLMKYDFRLVDDYTLKKIDRDASNKMINAVVPRQQFYDWCCGIMSIKCNGCTKDWNTCNLYDVFEDNFIPESGFNCDNCKFAYSLGGNHADTENVR